MSQQLALERAKRIRLDLGEAGREFAFCDAQGGEWEADLDQWIGNGSFAGSECVVSKDERQYVLIGSSDRGMDQILLRDDGAVCILSGFDQQLSTLAGSVDEFVTFVLGFYPRTLDAAVEHVLLMMTDDFKVWLRNFEGDEFELRVQLATRFTDGMSVRELLGLWGKNPELLAQLPRFERHPDSASSYFLVECWRRLRLEAS